MPKTISIAPSWYWPAGVPRFCGIPPFGIKKLILRRAFKERPDEVLLGDRESSLTGKELVEAVTALSAKIDENVPKDAALRLSGTVSVASVLLGLAGISSSRAVELAEGEGPAVLESSSKDSTSRIDATFASAGMRAIQEDSGNASLSGTPTLGWSGLEAYHTQTTLMAAAISLSLFYPEYRGASIVVALPTTSWAWPGVVLMALYRLSQTVIADPADPMSLLGSGQFVVFGELEQLGRIAREAKKEIKAARGRVACVIATIEGPFDPSSRKRLEKLLDCPVLTLLGSHEAGPVIGAHSSWYLAESAGIPITNADVIPVDPRSRQPLDTLWELVEYARITVHSPMVAAYRRVQDGFVRNIGNLSDLGLLGSSDPNGMIYILPE